MNLETVQNICRVGIENPLFRRHAELLIQGIVTVESTLPKMYKNGATKLSLVRKYKEFCDVPLMTAKKEIEARFDWPNPNNVNE